jgi:hypothetical protein
MLLALLAMLYMDNYLEEQEETIIEIEVEV